VAIRERLRRLEGDGPELCESCPHKGPILCLVATRIVYPDGSEEFHRDPEDPGDEPTQFCARCPYGPGGEEPPITLIEVVRTIEAGEHVT